MKKKKKNRYCRLCRKKITIHGNNIYCDKRECKDRYKHIRKKQVRAAKSRFVKVARKKKVLVKQQNKKSRIEEARKVLNGIQ